MLLLLGPDTSFATLGARLGFIQRKYTLTIRAVHRVVAGTANSHAPPAKPEASRLPAPQRGLIATDQSQNPATRHVEE